MRIVHRHARGERIVDIDIDDPRCTVADMLAALGSPPPVAASAAVIDGHVLAAHLPLSDAMVCEGSVIETGPRSTADATTTPATRMLAVTGGIRAGGMLALGTSVTVGRSAASDVVLDDLGLDGAHLRVDATTIEDLGSGNGTAVDGHPVVGHRPIAVDTSIRVGTTRLCLRCPVDDQPVAVAAGLGARGGLVPFNRPPRPAPPVTPTAVPVPGPAPAPPEPEALSVAGIVLPVLLGALVAVLFSPYLALFAALGPVLTVGTWWERRRRARRDHRSEMAAFHRALAAFADRLPEARAAEMARRRRLHPDPAEVVRRARGLSVRLWERRAGDPDAFVVAIGVDDEDLVVVRPDDDPAPEAVALVAGLPALADVPVELDLRPGRTVGLVGDAAARIALARSVLLQMAVHHGPADLAIVVAADRPADWSWASWLPHLADATGGRRGVALLRTEAGDQFGLVAPSDGRALFAVLDGDDPFQGRSTVGRAVLRHEQAAALVLVDDAHRLPAGCADVVRVDALGRLEVIDPRRPGRGRRALGWGVPADLADGAARRLARLDDPELPMAGAGIPGTVSLLALLGVDGDDPDAVERRWRVTDGTADLATPIGADGDGPVLLDLVADGPHVLVGGTTGAGKSELLRSLVAGVAASADPDHVAMVLVDYKGGAAFDCCADLPHVAGLVTDLDASLAGRALRCLEAELRHREQRLRAVGAEDLTAHRRSGDADEPLPRLLVVVDEFASMVADLPDFVDALVGIAQRGRSLGVHLVLATQRPAGVITDDIRANTACRIALRVTDRNDSVDVVGVPDAAALPRSRPGRAMARFGPDQLVSFQSALVTGRTAGRPGVTVRSERVGRSRAVGPTDLERLVAAIGRAHQRRGGRRPRAPWPPPLPALVARGALANELDAAPHDFLLVDDPDRQCQRLSGWRPSDGNLVVVGSSGGGSSTTLATAAIAAAGGGAHVHVVDLAGGDLAPLAALASVGTLAGPSDTERRARLVRWVDDEVAARRADPGGAPRPELVLVVDDFGGLARAHDPVREPAIHERMARIWAEGPAVGVVVAASVRRAVDLPPACLAAAGTVLLHRSTDAGDALRFAVTDDLSDLGPGRAVRVTDGARVQVIVGGPTIADAVTACDVPSPPAPPHDVGILATVVPFTHPDVGVVRDAGGVALCIALRDRDLRGHELVLHRGQHALVVGGPRTGRTNTLAAIARAAGETAIVVGDGELARCCGAIPTAPAALDSAIQGRGAALVLVDDATEVDDPAGQLAAIVDSPPPGVHVIAAVRPDRLRAAYGHWVTELRSSRTGLLLRPDPIDGDLVGVQLPARLDLPAVPGRALGVVDGTIEVVQVVDARDQSAS